MGSINPGAGGLPYERSKQQEFVMNQTALLIFGAAVVAIVFVGIFAYGMMSFSRWSDADSKN
jgi:hypothetical protein